MTEKEGILKLIDEMICKPILTKDLKELKERIKNLKETKDD